jgi:hypothetical protein
MSVVALHMSNHVWFQIIYLFLIDVTAYLVLALELKGPNQGLGDCHRFFSMLWQHCAFSCAREVISPETFVATSRSTRRVILFAERIAFFLAQIDMAADQDQTFLVGGWGPKLSAVPNPTFTPCLGLSHGLFSLSV